MELTLDQIKEINRCKNDLIYFIDTYVKINHPTKGVVPLKLYDYQKRLIRSVSESDNHISSMGRQFGLTTPHYVYLLWYIVFETDRTVFIETDSNDMAKNILERIWISFKELPIWMRPKVATNNLAIKKLDNGNTIYSNKINTDTKRGITIDLLYLDNFAYVPDENLTDFITALIPKLSNTNSRILISSCMNTRDDIFMKIWEGAYPSEYSSFWNGEYTDQELSLGDREFSSFFADWKEIVAEHFKVGKLMYLSDDSFSREYNSLQVEKEI